jgi:glycerophosphoryl diester phosphodiesterase
MHHLAHRGFWRTPNEKNSETAIRRAFENGFGIETDIRDCNGRLVISHDPPTADAMDFETFLDIYLTYPGRTKLALNVKADGMQCAMKTMLDQAGVTNYVVFDMSIPDLLGYRKAAMPFYVRRSEFEGASSLDADAVGIWLDSFERPFADGELLTEAATATSGDIALVSPELHHRPHLEAWEYWRGFEKDYGGRFWLCTDFPDEAQAFFATGG